MSGRLGLELTPSMIRGVWARGWTSRPGATFELAWDPQAPEAAVAALRATHDTPDTLCLAIGLGFLHVAVVELPPAPDEAREAMIALEPDRYFPTSAPLQVSLAPGSPLALATDAAWLARVRTAFATWAPLARVESAPVALTATDLPDGTFAMLSAPSEHGVLSVAGGALRSVRRVTAALTADALPPVGAMPGDFRTAWGALCREDAPTVGTLMPDGERRAVRGRTLRSVATAALGAAAALAFLAASVDRSRERTLVALTAQGSALTTEAAPALAAQARLLSATRERSLVRTTMAGRPDAAGTLAALGQLLPRDVVITTARATGSGWQVEGTARDAAALVPALDADPRFDNVRSLAASSRFRDGRETRESFSIAFDARLPR